LRCDRAIAGKDTPEVQAFVDLELASGWAGRGAALRRDGDGHNVSSPLTGSGGVGVSPAFSGDTETLVNTLRRLPEKNVPDCAGFSADFKVRQQAHSRTM
jgi:hypothetical protein